MTQRPNPHRLYAHSDLPWLAEILAGIKAVQREAERPLGHTPGDVGPA